MLDAGGRPTTKTCECGAVLGRTARSCTVCNREFMGFYTKRRREEREAMRLNAPQPAIPLYPEIEAQLDRMAVATRTLKAIPETVRRWVAVGYPANRDAGFDCDALPDGGLRLVTSTGEQILTPRQVDVILMELRMAGRA